MIQLVINFDYNSLTVIRNKNILKAALILEGKPFKISSTHIPDCDNGKIVLNQLPINYLLEDNNINDEHSRYFKLTLFTSTYSISISSKIKKDLLFFIETYLYDKDNKLKT